MKKLFVAPTLDGKNFFAMGNAITISERTDGEAGAKITWDGGSMNVGADVSVFGADHFSDVVYEETNITMNGGTLRNIFGGGFHKSHVKVTNVVVNGGKVTGIVHGGGAASFSGTTCHQPWYAGVASESPTIVDEANVTVNDGEIYIVYGGGEGISATKETTVIINDGKIGYAIAGGSNGYTGEATMEVNGGEITTLQAVNRGSMKSSEIEVNGGKIENAYVAGDSSDSGVNGTIEEATMNVYGGEVKKLMPGSNGGPNTPATDVVTLNYVKSAVEDLADNFDEDKIEVYVTITFVGEEEGDIESIPVPKGFKFTTDQLQTVIDEINKALKEDNLELDGFYTDEKFTEKFDFTNEINEDVIVFVKTAKLAEVTNPETSDINVIALIGLMALGALGLGYTVKKRFN